MVEKRKIKYGGQIGLYSIWAVCLLALSLAILLPLIFVFATPRLDDFSFVFKSPQMKAVVLNTFLECVCSTLASVIIGYIYAYAVVRGNIPFAKFFAAIPLIHLMTPPFVGGLSFILLLGRNGFITHRILGLDVSLYGFWGLLIAQSLCFFPIAYMILVSAIQNINPSLERAALSLGCGKLRTFFTVTLPLSFPGILAAGLFIAVSVMSDFGNPMIVAGRYKVLAVEIYTQLTGWVSPGKSAVLGIILVIPSLILFVLQNYVTRKNSIKFSTIGGKTTFVRGEKPSKLATVLLTIFCSFITLCVLAQFVSIVAGSFQKLWGINTEWTLTHIQNLRRYKKEIFNSIRFALEGAAVSTIFASVVAYLVYRTKVPFKKYLDSLTQLSAAVPGSLFGLAFSICANKLNIHSSAFLIVIAIAVGFLPFSYRIMVSNFSQIKTTLDDGATSLGASKIKVLTTIYLPISRHSLGYAFLYDFVRGVGTMSAVIFLVSFKTPLTSIKILNLAEEGFWGDAAAFALLLTLITFGILGLGKLFVNLIKVRRHKAKSKLLNSTKESEK